MRSNLTQRYLAVNVASVTDHKAAHQEQKKNEHRPSNVRQAQPSALATQPRQRTKQTYRKLQKKTANDPPPNHLLQACRSAYLPVTSTDLQPASPTCPGVGERHLCQPGDAGPVVDAAVAVEDAAVAVRRVRTQTHLPGGQGTGIAVKRDSGSGYLAPWMYSNAPENRQKRVILCSFVFGFKGLPFPSHSCCVKYDSWASRHDLLTLRTIN